MLNSDKEYPCGTIASVNKMRDARNQTVSVVVTCYNYGRYVASCIESVLSQTYHDLEIVVVNDGSSDGSDNVIRRFIPNPKITYISQGNMGQARAKNTGIRNSGGEFIAFLDADDLWEKNKLENQMPLFRSPDVGVVYSRARYIDEEGRELNYSLSDEHLRPRSGRVTEALFMDNFVPFSATVVRRACLKNAGGFDESLKMGIDWDLWLRFSVFWEFAYVDEPLLIYRLGHADQMSRNITERQRCADRIMHKFLSNHRGILSPSAIDRAWAYTCCNRGEAYRSIDRKMSNYYFLRSIRRRLFQRRAYEGLFRNLIERGPVQ